MEVSGETLFEPSDDTRGVIADAALTLAETQLLAQVADDASLDGRATGLIGFNGALLAAVIAAKELVELGPYGPSPIGVVVLATFMLLWGLYGGRRRLDRRDDHLEAQSNRVGVSVGVRADKFYETYAEGPPLEARERLLDDLVLSFDKNSKRITRKRRWLQAGTLFLIVGLAASGSMILLDRPTNMEKSWPKNPQSHYRPHHPNFVRCLALPGSNKSGRAAKARIKRGTHGVLVVTVECG